MRRTRVTIAAGDIDEQAESWLKSHGAVFESSLGVSLIELPPEALVEKGGYGWQYTVAFYDAQGNYEPSYVEIELDVDLMDTRLRFHKEGME